jgi:hypothetical protein
MGRIGGVGAQGKSFVLMVWAFGNSFVRGGRFLGAISVLILVRAPRFAFGMMFGVGIEPLKEAFPGLFIIASAKETSIADNVERSNGTLQWNIQFSWLVHDWEVEVVASFYRCLYSSKLKGVGEDKL